MRVAEVAGGGKGVGGCEGAAGWWGGRGVSGWVGEERGGVRWKESAAGERVERRKMRDAVAIVVVVLCVLGFFVFLEKEVRVLNWR